MPDGGWTDPKMIARGKEVYTGKVSKKVKCAKCHGVKGKPKAKGARDFRKAANMEKFSDTYWFFRIADGVPKTLMKGWLGKISEDDIWAVMAYENTFSHGGKPAEPDTSNKVIKQCGRTEALACGGIRNQKFCRINFPIHYSKCFDVRLSFDLERNDDVVCFGIVCEPNVGCRGISLSMCMGMIDYQNIEAV